MCVLQSLDSVKPQDVPGSAEAVEGWEPSQKTSRPSWPYLLKEPIALCSLKCGDTVDSQWPFCYPKASSPLPSAQVLKGSAW